MTQSTRPDPADLWKADPDSLKPCELSSLLEECTGWTLEAVTDEDGPGFYLRDPYGDRDGDGCPWRDLADIVGYVASEIDDAIADR